MVKKFKDKLDGERIVLKRTKPTFQMAKTMFKVVNDNRSHISPWLVWEKFTLREEDSFEYLSEKEKETNEGKKVEYGIYLDKEYIGNIAMFDINMKNKSGEIGYWLSSNFVRKGYVREAVKILERYFFEDFGLNRILIKCDEENIASSEVARKCGYTLEGKLRQDSFNENFNEFRNTLVFSKLKSEFKL